MIATAPAPLRGVVDAGPHIVAGVRDSKSFSVLKMKVLESFGSSKRSDYYKGPFKACLDYVMDEQ